MLQRFAASELAAVGQALPIAELLKGFHVLFGFDQFRSVLFHLPAGGLSVSVQFPQPRPQLPGVFAGPTEPIRIDLAARGRVARRVSKLAQLLLDLVKLIIQLLHPP